MPKLFLCGDVMTGRGIDQILAAPCDPAIGEPWAKDARDYVELAERASGGDAEWLAGVLHRIGAARVARTPDNRLRLQ